MANQDVDDFMLSLDEDEVSKIVQNLDRIISSKQTKKSEDEIEKTEVIKKIQEPEDTVKKEKTEREPRQERKQEDQSKEHRKREDAPREKPHPAPQQPVQDEDEDATTYLSEDSRTNITLIDIRTGEIISVTSPFFIGKNKNNNLSIHETVISRRHAKIHERNGKVYVMDLGSLNGTFLNNVKLPPNVDVEARSGQEVMFANQRYRIEF